MLFYIFLWTLYFVLLSGVPSIICIHGYESLVLRKLLRHAGFITRLAFAADADLLFSVNKLSQNRVRKRFN